MLRPRCSTHQPTADTPPRPLNLREQTRRSGPVGEPGVPLRNVPAARRRDVVLVEPGAVRAGIVEPAPAGEATALHIAEVARPLGIGSGAVELGVALGVK